MRTAILTLAAAAALALTAGTADAQYRPMPGVVVYPTVSSSPYTYGYRPYMTFGYPGYVNPYPTYNMGYSYNYGYSYGTPYSIYGGYNYSQSYYSGFGTPYSPYWGWNR